MNIEKLSSKFKQLMQKSNINGALRSIVYEDIDEDLVKKAAIKTKGGCGPSGLDADNWRRILVSNQFGSSPLDLRTSIANFVKRLCNTNIHLSNSDTGNSLEAFTASRLIPRSTPNWCR